MKHQHKNHTAGYNTRILSDKLLLTYALIILIFAATLKRKGVTLPDSAD